ATVRAGVSGRVRSSTKQGWYFTGGSPKAETLGSTHPTYATQVMHTINGRLHERCTGSFCHDAGNRNPHRYCSFAERTEETAVKSLRHSCRSELTRQGISLP